jgi:hypothetical protein
MTATAERTCPVCRSPQAAPLFTKEDVDDWNYPDCHFRFATPDRNPNLSDTLEEYEDAWSGHRGRLRSIGYMIRYGAEFVGGIDAPGWARRFDRW